MRRPQFTTTIIVDELSERHSECIFVKDVLSDKTLSEEDSPVELSKKRDYLDL